MSKLLYIKASPMGELSSSTVVADAFVEAYIQANRDDEVETIELFGRELPAFGFEEASAKYKIMHGKEHTEADRQRWAEVVAVIEKFKSGDKYLIAVPMWNFSIPYRLKQYIDVIVQPGHTFTVTEGGGYEGLVKDRPAVVVYARGGQYPPGTEYEAFDLQKKYLELVLRFIGFEDIRSVVVEPTLAGGPETAEQKRAEAIEEARRMAAAF